MVTREGNRKRQTHQACQQVPGIATQYVPTIETFEDCHWESILEAVWEILSEGSRRKRSKSLSSQVSSDFNMEEAEAEENYTLISDDQRHLIEDQRDVSYNTKTIFGKT